MPSKIDIKLSELSVELSPDEEIIALIDSNTNKFSRVPDAVLKCLTMIAAGSALATSCKLTGIPPSTLQRWRSQEWYPRVIELLRKQQDEALDGKFTRRINIGLDKLSERLLDGDPIVNTKSGIVTGYRPVGAKDAAIISSILFDKRNLLRNKPTAIITRQTTDERLDKLAQRFRDIATVDGDYVEVTDDDIDEVKSDYVKTHVNEDCLNVKGISQKTEVEVCDPSPSGSQLGEDIWEQEEGESDSESTESDESFTFSAA